MQKDMRYCLKLFESADRLLKIEKTVDPKFEIPALMKAAEKMGKAVLFKNVKNSTFPVISNIFGTREMLALLFESSPEKVVEEWLTRAKEPIEPKLVPAGPVKEIRKRASAMFPSTGCSIRVRINWESG